MITKITKISKACGTCKFRIEGENLTKELVNSISDIKSWSTFGNSISISGDGKVAEVNCYYD